MIDIVKLWQEVASELECIDVIPGIMNSEPCIAGTRIPVSIIVSMVGEDLSITSVLLEYEHLSNREVSQALLFAARLCFHPVKVRFDYARVK